MNYAFETTEYEITGKEMLTANVALFKMKGRLDFKPGQFVEVSLPRFGNITLVPCSDPADKKQFDLCVRAVGSTSNALIKLLPGDKISLRGPYGNGWHGQQFKNHNIVIIAGGMGTVPLRPILFDLEKKAHFSKLSLFAGFKKPGDVLFEKDLKRWKKKFRVRVVVEQTGRHFWGERGLITDTLKTSTINNKSVVLMCGPEIMYSYCVETLAKKGISKQQIYVSLERRMECGIGLCQHCSCGKNLVCQDGPIFRYDEIESELSK